MSRSTNPEYADRLHKKLQWLGWLGGTAVAIAVGGYSFAVHLSSFESKADAERVHSGQREEIKEIEQSSAVFEKKLQQVRYINAKIRFQQEITDGKLDVLIEQTDRERGRGGAAAGRERLDSLRQRLNKLEELETTDEEDPLGILEDMP